MSRSYPGVGIVVSHVNLGRSVTIVAFQEAVPSGSEGGYFKGSWAAYIVGHDGDLPLDSAELKASRHGHKLYETEARVFFPGLKDIPYRR